MKYGIHDNGHVDVVVVGGGVAGVELSLSIQERWRSLTRNLSITILDSGALLLPTESDDCGSTLSRLLFERNVVVRFNSVVKEVKSNELTLVDGSDVPFNHCLWATGAAAHTFANKTLRDRGVAVNENGWIRVRPSLQSVSHAHIFASGDCSNIEGLPNRKSPPKAGLYAVRAGPILIRNLVAFLGYHNEGLGNDCSDLINYSPQDDFLKLIGCGDGTAVGFRFGFAMQGKWVWKMKDHIDRTFMDLFAEEKLPTLSKVEDNGTLQYGHREKCDSEILPCKAGTLLLRTDDNVDYKMASKILQHMKDSDEYRKAVLSAMLEHRYQSNFRPCSS